MKGQNYETISIFNKRFSNFYYKIHIDIQLFEVVPSLSYGIFFHPYFELLLMERKFMTLQQMLNDELEIEIELEREGSMLPLV